MQISKFLEPYDLSVYHIYEGFLYLCMIIGDICQGARKAKRLNLWNRATNAQNECSQYISPCHGHFAFTDLVNSLFLLFAKLHTHFRE